MTYWCSLAPRVQPGVGDGHNRAAEAGPEPPVSKPEDLETEFLAIVECFLRECHVDRIEVRDLLPGEPDRTPAGLKVGDVVTSSSALEMCRLAWRNNLWVHLSSAALEIYFGFDWYVYFGTATVSHCQTGSSAFVWRIDASPW